MLGLGLGANKRNKSKGSIVKNGLVLNLDGRDFSNYPPTSVWNDRSGLGNNATPSGFGYIKPYDAITSDLAGTNQNVIEYSTGDGKVHYEVEGETQKNEIVNGNFASSASGWGVIGSSMSVASNTLTNTITSSTVGTTLQNTSLSCANNKKIYVKWKRRVTNSNCANLSFHILGSGGGAKYSNGFIGAPIANQWYTDGMIVTLDNTFLGTLNFQFLHGYIDSATALNKVLEMQQVMCIDLTAKYGAGNEPTVAQCDIIYANWFDGIKSVGEDLGGTGVHKVDVLSRGKNLFNIANYAPNANVSVNGTAISVNGSTSSVNGYTSTVKLVNGKQYTLSINVTRSVGTSPAPVIAIMNNGVYSSINIKTTGTKTLTFTATKTEYSTLTICNWDAGTMDVTVDSIQLEEGSTSTTYVPYTEDKNSLTLAQPLRKLPSGVMDKYSEGSVSRNIGKVVLNGSENWYSHQSSTDYISFMLTDTLTALWKVSGLSISDKFVGTIWDGELTSEKIWRASASLGIVIAKSKLATQDVAGFKTWLASNNTTVFYELATPTTETITVPQLSGFANGSLLVDGGVIPAKTNLLTSLLSASSGSWKPLDVDMPTLPSGVKNEVVSGSVVQKVGKVVLNGSESWNLTTSSNANNIVFDGVPLINHKSNSITDMLSDKFITNATIYDGTLEGIQGSAGTPTKLYFSIAKSKLSTQDIAGFKAWLQANPVTVWYELATPIIGSISLGGKSSVETLNGTNLAITSNVLGSTPQIKVKFNLIDMIEKKYGVLPCTSDLASKIAWVKGNANTVTINGYVYGIGASGNKVYLDAFDVLGNVWTNKWRANTSSSPTLLYILRNPVDLPYLIDANGFAHIAVSTDTTNANSSGVFTPSTIFMDYISLQVTFKTPSGSDGMGGIVFDGVDDGSTVNNVYLPIGTSPKNFKIKFKVLKLGVTQVVFASGAEVVNGIFGAYINTSNKIVFWASGTNDIVTSYTVTLNEVLNICVDYDGTTLKLYVNNILVHSVAIALANVIGNIYIGKATTSCFSNIIIYNVLCYNRALTDAERTKNYKATR